MTKIWQKQSKLETNNMIEEYTVGVDYLLDLELIPYDIVGSKAHAMMLNKIGVLSDSEKNSLLTGLDEILFLHKEGKFKIDKYQEDGHTAIEAFLIDKLGEVGKKIHTGRSRNDQILVTTRLYSMEKIKEIKKSLLNLINVFDKKIIEIGNIKMPGYTHTQRAMPSDVAMWLGSFRDSFLDDIIFLEAAEKINNQNPLGSVASFGENVFGLDREYTTEILGFSKIQTNPMYCAYSRGKFEHIVLQPLTQIMLDLGKIASDLVLFSSKEFNYFNLPDEFKTGSSVMPQKKNWDVMELVRGNSNLFLGYEFQIREVYKNLLSGYNRDFQLTKEPYLKGIKLVVDTLKISSLVIENLSANKENLENSCTEELYATQEAYELVKSGMSFRDAYRIVGEKYI